MRKEVTLALALLALTGLSVEAQANTETLYQSSCDDGDATACSVLALMFETGQQGLGRDLDRAATLYGRACDLGDMEGCKILGDMYLSGEGVARDLARTVSLYERGCEGGELLACESLGLLHEAGRGVLVDEAEAARLYRLGCDGGQWSSCDRLGMLVQSGTGVTANPAEALDLFARACDGGYPRGCVNLGVGFQRGEGVEADPVVARDLYQAACDAGDQLGCVNLGSLYRTGTGVAQDARMAVSLYRRACDANEAMGCYNLGTSYEQGVGVPEDRVTAVASMQRACSLGLQLGCQRLPSQQRAAAEPIDSSVVATYGVVQDAETEDPVPNAIVDFPDLGIRLVSDRSGQVDLPDLPVGSHLIRAEAAGYQVTEGRLRVPGEEFFVVMLDHDLVADPDAAGRIVGRVTDETGEQGLSDVDISVVNRLTGRAISNPVGRFGLQNLQPGLVELRFDRLGYESRTSQVIVQPGITIDVLVRMATEPIPLEPIQVVAVRSPALERAGFYDRARTHHGAQFGPAEIEKYVTTHVSDIFWRAPGVTVEGQGNIGEPVRVVTTRRQGATYEACALEMYLDGVRNPGYDINEIPPATIEAIEVYQGLDTPAQFERSSSVQCGVILIWTKRGA